MKIETVDTFLAHTYLLVRLRTDSGLTGWGHAAYFSYPEASQKAPLRREGGYLIPSEAPGLGVEVDEAFLAKYPFRSGGRGQ